VFAISLDDARGELERLRQALDGLSLEPERRAAAEAALGAARRELAVPAPDRRRAAGELGLLVAVLRDARALAEEGDAVREPIVRLASWLGPLGAAALGGL
jgi:hypothetical protein